ncbi:MAG TPA: DegT/DnrJ/EryC1/StrS family aminotransferase [Nitrospira sp.]|jgi:dTDP-3-amino-2,3,6-trideoxy-4-keto-D-glucose/dTDP-3-amino-3,4,6-trideoxy-alpha-D-glucose/dTDP-2,6-dideoxy-D-kanosamine transaminase|nr:DegT/DnrJ/EryC1/StrS family aminotransferase [Nitrospira sp.]
MRIQVWDYRTEYETERKEILAGIEKVLDSGRLILGPSVTAFEGSFSTYCGAKYGIGVNSGTDALFLALKVLDVGPGDEVITVSNTAIPTVAAIVSTGATPKFVDIEPDTYLMDVGQLEAAITPQTKCILPVHLYGQCVDMERTNRIAKTHGLVVLEDCAQSHGAMQHGSKAGSMSELAAFSFYPTKILGTYGDGGMVITDNEAYAKRLRRLRMYGNEGTYYSVEHGYNSRLDELHAEILLRKLPRLDGYIARRRDLAQRYDEKLKDTPLILPKVRPGNFHAYYLYVVRHPSRETIMQRLVERGIHLNISYPSPIHTMTGYSYLGGKEGDLPWTEAVAKEIFSLPMYPGLADDEQDFVCESLHEIFREFL